MFPVPSLAAASDIKQFTLIAIQGLVHLSLTPSTHLTANGFI